MIISPLLNIPNIQPRDRLSEILMDAMRRNSIVPENNDILVLAQKIVSKSENRYINLTEVHPSDRANSLAIKTQKDPRLVELILRESKRVVREHPGILITEHRNGFICANAGIDHSNVKGPWGNHDDWVLLLPENPDKSAAEIRRLLERDLSIRLGVLIIDSHGRPWRNGTVGISIGFSGLPGLVDLRGVKDLFGYQLKVTQVAAADELAAAASLVMGQASESIPAVHVRDFPYSLREGKLLELLRPSNQDLFR